MPIEVEIRPLKELTATVKYRRAFKPESADNGSVPVRKLLHRIKVDNAVHRPSSVGMLAFNELLFIVRAARDDRRPSSVGILEMRRF